MPRARNIKPALFKNERLGEADPLLTILFIGLWTLADKRGRLECRPKRIKVEIFPYRDDLDINRYLTELSRLGFIQLYSDQKVPLIQIINFEKHQHPHHTEKESEYPAPENSFSNIKDLLDSEMITGNEPLNNGYAPSDSSNTDSSNTESGMRENSRPSRAKKRATRLPDEWALPDEWELWTRERYPAITYKILEREELKFHNYWTNRTDKNSAKLDWFKTWQNWMIKTMEE